MGNAPNDSVDVPYWKNSPIFAPVLSGNENTFLHETASSNYKETSVATVRDQYRTFASFSKPLGSHCSLPLKGHGNEADFLGFLQKLVPHRSLTLPFKPFQFGFEFAEIFVIEKRLPDSPSRRVGFWKFKRKFGESGSRYGVAIRIF